MQNDFQPRKPAPKLKPTSAPKKDQEQAVPFETPDQVQAHDQAAEAVSTPNPTEPVRGTGRRRFNLAWPPTRKQLIVLISILVLGVFGAVGFLVFNKSPTAPVAITAKKAAPKPTTVASTLSGLLVQPEVNQRPVVGVMIENSQAARPQSGLTEAGVVFEAVAEGGITRFLALFQDQQPTNIGPVRSARPYYVQWNEGFRAAYAHVGGSPEALQNIKDWGVQDLNQFYNPGPYHRVSSRPSPHNMYSSVVDLANLATEKGFKSEYTGFVRKKVAPAKQATATSVDLNISSALYNVHYAYDAASNTYIRSVGGAEHIDSNTGKHLTPTVVIAMVVPVSAGGSTSQGGAYSNYNPIGSGPVHIFQDGVVSIGTWTKTANTAPITFADAAGAPIALNPGQTWLSTVANDTKIIYK